MKSPLSKFTVFAALYISIGIPQGFFQKVAPYVLRQQGYDLDTIGYLMLLFVTPWILKFLWAPITDRLIVSGKARRKIYIIPLQILVGLLFLGMGFYDPGTDMQYFIRMVLALNLVAATQDAVNDGLAVDILEPAERGWGNGVQIGGYWSGFMLGGGILLMIQPHLGWSKIYYLVAAFVFVSMIPAILFREPPRTLQRSNLGIKSFFKRPGIFRLFLIILLARGASGLVFPLHVTFLHDQGYSLAQVGWITGLFGPVIALFGAWAAGTFANRLGRRRSLLWFTSGHLLTLLAFILLTSMNTDSEWAVISAIGLDHFVTAMSMVALFSLMMDWCNAEQGASEYTFMDCLGIFGTLVFSVLIHVLAEAMGYHLTFVINFGIMVVLIILLVVFYNRDFQIDGRVRRMERSNQN